MLRVHGILGLASDPEIAHRLHHVEHHGGIEILFLEEAEASRKRFRATTDKGTDCAVSLDRDEVLSDGAVLHLEHDRAVVLRFGAPKFLKLRARDAEAALKLGWNAGNLHWRVRFEDRVLVVLLDGPAEDYRARIAPLLDGGGIELLADD